MFKGPASRRKALTHSFLTNRLIWDNRWMSVAFYLVGASVCVFPHLCSFPHSFKHINNLPVFSNPPNPPSIFPQSFIFIYIYVCVCVCVCVRAYSYTYPQKKITSPPPPLSPSSSNYWSTLKRRTDYSLLCRMNQ